MSTLIRWVILSIFIVFFSFAQEKIFKFDVNSLKTSSKISIKSGSTSIPLPDGTVIQIEREKIEFRKDGFSIYGKVKGEKDSLVIITVVKGIAYGRVQIGEKIFKIEPVDSKEGLYKVIDFSGKESIPFKDDFIPYYGDIKESSFLIKPKNITRDDGSIVDVLLLYTRQLKQDLGAGLEAKLRNLVDLGNQILEQSQIYTKLNIVGIVEYESPDANEDNYIVSALSNLASSSEVKRLRNFYKADIVTLFRKYKGDYYCGYAYIPVLLPEDLESDLEKYVGYYQHLAYNVVDIGSSGDIYCPDVIYIHEVGHNFGCQHDKDHATGIGAYYYSYGYDKPGIFATIMSYDKPRINYFSNPNITYKGYQIGKPEKDPEAADNAKTINKTKILIANFRNSSEEQPIFAPIIEANPSSIDFGKVLIGETVSQTINITNKGKETLDIHYIIISGPPDFYIENFCSDWLLEEGENCQVKVYFSPEDEGVKEATLIIDSNAYNNPRLEIPVKGEGKVIKPPKIYVNKTHIDFGQVLNKTEKKETIYIENLSPDNPLVLEFEIPNSNDFKVIHYCPDNLDPNAICDADIIFAPQTPGKKSFVFYINSNDPENPKTEILAVGEALPRPANLVFEATIVDFGQVLIGEEKTEVIILKNEGDEVLKIKNIYTIGSDFKILESCSQINGNSSCKIKVAFSPTKSGEINGFLVIETDKQSYKIELKGEGKEPKIAKINVPTKTIIFPETIVGENSVKSLTIENKGNIDLSLSFSINGNDFFIKTNSCKSIKPSSSCSIEIVFSPKSPGEHSAKLIISSNDPNNPSISVSLKGKAVEPKLPSIFIDKPLIDFGQVEVGKKDEKILQIKNSGNDLLVIKQIKVDNEAFIVEGNCKEIQPNKSCSVKVIFSPKSAGDYVGKLTIISNDPDNPSVSVSLKGKAVEPKLPIISSLPSSISFPPTFIGSSSSKFFSIKNIGNAPLDILNIDVDDKENFEVVYNCKKVEPKKECKVEVIFRPKREGKIESQIRIKTNIGEKRIKVEGEGKRREGIIKVKEEKIEIGRVYIGEKVERKIEIENVGTGEVRIKEIKVEGEGYRLKGDCQVIKEKEKCEIYIEFRGEKEGIYEGIVRIKTDSRITPEVVIPLKAVVIPPPSPDIFVDRKEINFGVVEIGKRKEGILQIKNKGNALLIVKQIKVDSKAFVVEGDCKEIQPDKSCSVKVIFSPTSAGDYAGKLIIISNDPDNPSVSVLLKGKAVEPKLPSISVDKSLINFGQVLVGEEKTEKITIKNTGDANLIFERIYLTDNKNFLLKNNCPRELIPKSSCVLHITFSPKEKGTIQSTLYIQTNAKNNKQLTLSLKGKGVYITPDKADINKDGYIDFKDVEKLIEIAALDEDYLLADLNEDGKVDISDVILLIRKIRKLD
ncbi:MAG: choice-of-anchor D domain-containing protein [Aquificae bacterium]|nr:choice-of-anchor D domain-containing protein [Aquificota bacterium]